MAKALRPRRLVRDSKGRQAITLELQRGAGSPFTTRRWKVMRLAGGTDIESEESLTELGTVTQENFLEAIDSNRQGRRELAALFPEHVKTVLGG
ncbi:MAG: hypothetical protein MPN21_23225 [Thermoanaerobaculia bacterium]|nr:hypothetical protein [Thermoanaerobaculia bacterium]